MGITGTDFSDNSTISMCGAGKNMHGSDQLDCEQTVEIVLDPEVLGAICRQGRRRLRDIQSSSQAALKLDRFRGVLQVTGHTDSIANVQRQLESLSGPTMQVTAAVWAELMRTRTNPDPSQAAIALTQEQSGCRIHIDRNAEKVQLFGPKSKTDVGQKLLEELRSMCFEEAVNMKCPRYLDMQMLQTFAQEFGVTLQVEETTITVLGIEGAVVEAAKELSNYDSGERQLATSGKPSDIARSAIDDAMSKLMVAGGMSISGAVHFGDFVSDTVPLVPVHTSDNMMQGAVTSKVPPPTKMISASAKGQSQSHEVNGMFVQSISCGVARFCANCGKPSGAIGAANFCVYCGQPTEKTMNRGALPQAFSQGACQIYDPDMFALDRMPVSPTTPLQCPGVASNGYVQPSPINTMMPQFLQPQMPQMCSGGCSPVLMPASVMSDGMMMIACVPFGVNSQQGTQAVVSGNTASGFQAASNMMANTANGIQACMVPMAYGMLE